MGQSRYSKVFALSFGKGLNTVVSLTVLIVTARLLTKTDLATYRQTLLAYEMVLPLLGLGLSQGIYYLLPTARERLRGIASDAVVVLVVVGGLYSLFIAFGGSELLAQRFSNPAISHTLIYLIPLPVFFLLATLVSPVLVIRERITTLVIYKSATQFAIGGGVLLACIFWRSPESMIIFYVALTVLGGAIGLHLMIRSLPRDSWRPQFSGMLELVRFGLPIGAATMIGTLNKQIDRVIVAALSTPEEFAIYVLGAIELPLVGIITASVASVILVDMRKAVEAGDLSNAQKLFSQAARQTSVILIPAMCFVLAVAPLLITMLFSEQYIRSANVLRVYMLNVPLQIIFTGAAFVSLGMSGFILKRSVVSLLFNLVLSILLYRWLGPIGVAWATVVSGGLIAYAWNLPTLATRFQVGFLGLYPLELIGKVLLAAGIPASVLWFVVNLSPVMVVLSLSESIAMMAAMFCLFSAIYIVIGNRLFPREMEALWSIRRVFI